MTDPNEPELSVTQECYDEVQEALKKHNCVIVPFIMPPEGVGDGTSKVLLTANWGVQEKKK